MIINDYGNFTKIHFTNFDSIDIPGHHTFELGSNFKLADGSVVIIGGYTHYRHGEKIRTVGKQASPRSGWTVSEVIGIGIVNPRAVAIGVKR